MRPRPGNGRYELRQRIAAPSRFPTSRGRGSVPHLSSRHRTNGGNSSQQEAVLLSLSQVLESTMPTPLSVPQPPTNFGQPSPAQAMPPSPSEADSFSSSSSHNAVAALQCSLQSHPETAPQRLLVNVFPGWKPNSDTLCLHLKPNGCVESHYAASPCGKHPRSTDHESQDDQDCRPAKKVRARRSLSVSRKRSRLEETVFTPLVLNRLEGDHDVDVSKYGHLVDLGLIRMFPFSDQPQNPTCPPSNTRSRRPWTSVPLDSLRQLYRMIVTRVTELSPVVIIVLTTAGLILIVILYASLVSDGFHLLTRSPPRPTMTVDYTDIDVNQEAIELEIALASLPRIIIHGEVREEPWFWSSEQLQWPIDGPVHTTEWFYDETLSKKPNVLGNWFSNHTEYPHYMPWETTSNGIFVPTTTFFQEVKRVVDTICKDLAWIADHGPPEFLFSSGSTTQFRWSTSGTEFLSPHLDLPTIPIESLDILDTATTIQGMSPSTPGVPLCPTARPPSPEYIQNLDPNLSTLRSNISRTLSSILQTSLEEQLVSSFPAIGISRAKRVIHELGELAERLSSGQEDWGSDQSRLNWMFDQRHTDAEITYRPEFPGLKETAPPIPVTTRYLPTNTADISGIPEDFIQGWRDYMSARARKSPEGEEEPTTTLTIKQPNRSNTGAEPMIAETPWVPCPMLIYIPDTEHSTTQHDNRAAKAILDALDNITHRPLDRKADGIHSDPTYGDIITYAERLEQLYTHTRSISDRIAQVLDNVDADDIDQGEGFFMSETKQALRRLRDVQRFINEIVLPRLSILKHRATRGAALLKSLHQRQNSLRSKIENLMQDGEHNNTHRLYFPSVCDIAEKWGHVARWLQAEAEEMHIAWHSQQEELKQQGSFADRKIIWSRWESRDCRSDPGGREAWKWDAAEGQDGIDDAERRHGCGRPGLRQESESKTRRLWGFEY